MLNPTALCLSLLAFVAASPQPVQNVEKRQSAVPYGVIINDCTVPGTVSLAFDDGPYIYTDQVLDMLDAAGMKATFFVNGQNYDSIYNYIPTIQRMYNEGHQVASHTWDHADLTTLSVDGDTSEMTQLETALLSIIGVFPTYMRPPYFSTNGQVLSTLGSLGYHVVQASIDTLDWQYNTADTIGNSVSLYQNAVSGGYAGIPLAHDTLPNTVQTLVPAMISALQAAGLTSVPVGACLGDPQSNWYTTSRTGGSTGGGTGVSTDGTCAGNGLSCPSGECCSQYDWCGTTSDYCGAGCQSGFGQCS